MFVMSKSEKELLVCNDITICYDKKNVLENLSMSVCEGDYISIVGENGTGKSSLIKGILGLVPLKTGQIKYENGMEKKHIGYLPQNTENQSSFPASVFEIILSGTLTGKKFKPFYTAEDKKAVYEVMEKLGISEYRKEKFGNLSGGQKQRVMLSRAMVSAQKILFLDEPVTGLDPVVTAEFYDLIHELNQKEKIAVVMVSHDMENSMKYANKIRQMSENDYFFGTKDEYLSRQRTLPIPNVVNNNKTV